MKKKREKILPVKKPNNKYYLIIVIAVAIIGAGIFSYAAFFQEKEEPTQSAGTVSGESTNEVYMPESQPPVVNMPPEQKAQAELRDKKRVEDIKRLTVALGGYYKDKKEYPKNLTDLLPKYIDAIPGNPNPGGMNYSYTGIGSEPYKFYDLVYVLEVGTEGIEAGMHDATPNGIAQP